ncbi:PhoH family protein [Bifidobacterium sp. ESL0790]|uniref:PhoH family protein n=1 Tax=Bifidobacterium sp. ESL0790 TaxID=2983233 RepID=UPI0023FA0F87|nr:PhoH family protein [Bifidobacterium sp. ESL0790]WEV73106.1 PhoH family protein [Bifidobacterium sp. ESL0790]
MASAKRVITIPTTLDPVAVLGPGDDVLREVERAFPHVAVFVRGNRIEVSAYSKRDEIEADKVADVFAEIIQSAYESPVESGNVRRMLEAREIGRHARLNGNAERGTATGERSGKASLNASGSSDYRSAARDYSVDTAYGEDDETVSEGRRKPRIPGVITMAAGEPVRAKTAGQVFYVGAIEENTITFAIGPAGTGKTYLAVAKAVRAFQDGKVSRIILTRPAVEAGESLGFLPGTLNDKVDPYLRPLYDALSDMLGTGQLHRYMSDGTIEVAPLAYMRGRTLNDAFVILDEAQNTTEQQMKMFLTRLGFNTKMVITGDVTQIDLTVPHSGLRSIESILGGIDDIAFVHLGAKDVVRHALVGRIVKAYDTHDAARQRRSARHDNSSDGDGTQADVNSSIETSSRTMDSSEGAGSER